MEICIKDYFYDVVRASFSQANIFVSLVYSDFGHKIIPSTIQK